MKILTILGLVLAMAILAGCQTPTTTDDGEMTGQLILEDDDFVFIDDADPDQDEVIIVDDSTEDIVEPADDYDVEFTVTVTEGELVKLDFEAVDPDGDSLDYTFTEPLNEAGRWQTSLGDEGRYLVTVTASDGKLSTSEDVLIIVNRANRAPIIECPGTIMVLEGESLVVDCNIYDEEGDNILVSYEGWVTSSTKETGFDDAGEYTVLVRASDGNTQATKNVNVVVQNVNRPPTIAPIDDLTVMETTDISIVPRVEDPDGDEVRVSFSRPLDRNGEWETNDGDAGEYSVTVTASDGTSTASTSFTITVTQINTAPVLKTIEDLEVSEGETIRIPVNAYDPEGDELTVVYSGFMDSSVMETGFDDAGVYDQTVTVSDGVLETTQSFTITIVDQNRPPQFKLPGE